MGGTGSGGFSGTSNSTPVVAGLYARALFDVARKEADAEQAGRDLDGFAELVAGNEALALGALAAGLTYYAAYPMTPASTILHYLAKVGPEQGCVVKQMEDEIGAMAKAVQVFKDNAIEMDRLRAEQLLHRHRSGRTSRAHLAMSIAPLHGRPAPLLFVRQKPRDDQPTFRLSDLKSAPLSSRARRLRRRRLWTLALVASMALLVLAVSAWTVRIWWA